MEGLDHHLNATLGGTPTEMDWLHTLEEFEGAVDRLPWLHAYNSYMEKYER